MSRGKLYAMVGGMGVMAVMAAVALTLVFSQGGSGPAGSSPEPVASAVGLAQTSGETVASGGPGKALPQGGPVSESGLEAVAAPAPSGGGTSEGIKVHGHWTIEVREPDGTLVSRTEFQNAITSQGNAGWTNILGRSLTSGKWRVGVTSTSSPCGGTTRCIIGESTDSGPEPTPPLFKTLTVNSPATGVPSPFKLVLSGNFTAQATGNVGTVSSAAGNCAPTTAPASCIAVGNLENPATSTTLVSPVSVTLGQQVLITVNITFS